MVGGGAPLRICLDTPGYPWICLHHDVAVSIEVPEGVGGVFSAGHLVLL